MYKTAVRHNFLDWIDSMRTSRGPQSLDKVVGRNIRVHRLAKGMSQTDLANELGITFQQIQKYEKGTNRVGSGRLFEISVILGVSVLTLFEGGKATLAKGDDSSPFNLLADPLSLRLVQAFAEISERRTRHSLVDLVESMKSRKN
jgi:transcriptional regulator with XRE-family HTH domain